MTVLYGNGAKQIIRTNNSILLVVTSSLINQIHRVLLKMLLYTSTILLVNSEA